MRYVLAALFFCFVWASKALSDEDRLHQYPHSTTFMMCSSLDATEALLSNMRKPWGTYQVLNEIMFPAGDGSDCGISVVGTIKHFAVVAKYEPMEREADIYEDWVILIEYEEGIQFYVVFSRTTGRSA